MDQVLQNTQNGEGVVGQTVANFCARFPKLFIIDLWQVIVIADQQKETNSLVVY